MIIIEYSMNENNSDSVEKSDSTTIRKQKNLRIGEDYHDQLEDLAQDWFGSSQKQGHVVERLLDLYADDSIESMLKEVHEAVVERGDNPTVQNSTHTQSQGNKTDEELEEIIRLSEEGEPIDPEEYDLNKIKGERDVDNTDVWLSVLSHTHPRSPIAKEDVRSLIREHAGYKYNAANQQANDAIRQLEQVPVLEDDIQNQVQDDIDNNARKTVGNSRFTRKQYEQISKPKEYAALEEELNTGHYVLTTDELAMQAYFDLCSIAGKIHRSSGSEKRRAKNLYNLYVTTLPDSIKDYEVKDGTTLRESIDADIRDLF
jgi:hypothetical protein